MCYNKYMRILTLERTAPFSYLWLKHVTGVNLNTHCAKSLLGEYLPDVSANITELHDIALPDGIYYLCGVSNPYCWSRNFHLAFCNGSDVIDVDYNGVHVVLEGACRLPIDTESMVANAHPKIRYKSYNTCRNWQFANWLVHSGIFKST